MRTSALSLLVVLAGTALASCFNPVHSDAVAALGPEAPGEEPGAEHRAGQPCLTCHGGSGPAGPHWSFAGTVFEKRGGRVGAKDVIVTLTDATGASQTLRTNKVGNFYLRYENWSPTYPVGVALKRDGATATMYTTIGRNGACAFCHYGDVAGPDHMPSVVLDARP